LALNRFSGQIHHNGVFRRNSMLEVHICPVIIVFMKPYREFLRGIE
jgi:hypothetical protein